MESKYIEIVEDGASPTGKTKVWRVRNKRTGESVGLIKWYGGFRKYVFYPAIEDATWVLFDQECLTQIAGALILVNEQRRAQRRGSVGA